MNRLDYQLYLFVLSAETRANANVLSIPTHPRRAHLQYAPRERNHDAKFNLIRSPDSPSISTISRGYKHSLEYVEYTTWTWWIQPCNSLVHISHYRQAIHVQTLKISELYCNIATFTLHLNHIPKLQTLLTISGNYNLEVRNPVVQSPCPYLTPL